MSFRQRALPLMLTAFVGVASGIYVFDPLLKQYAVQSRGTFDPEIARASAAGGVGGGAILSDQELGKDGKQQPSGVRQEMATMIDQARNVPSATNDEQRRIGGHEARQKVRAMLDEPRDK